MDTILSKIRRTNEGLDDFTSNMVHRFALLDNFSSKMDHPYISEFSIYI